MKHTRYTRGQMTAAIAMAENRLGQNLVLADMLAQALADLDSATPTPACPNRPHGEHDYCATCDGGRANTTRHG